MESLAVFEGRHQRPATITLERVCLSLRTGRRDRREEDAAKDERRGNRRRLDQAKGIGSSVRVPR